MRLAASVSIFCWFIVSPKLCTAELPPANADGDSIAIAESRICDRGDSDGIESPGQIVVAYFTPRDRKPASEHTQRISRIVEEAGSFYCRELQRHGFPNREMSVLRNENGTVDIIDVVGRGRDRDYDKPDGQKIRNETVAVLRQRGIDPSRIVLLLFCNLMDYDPVASKISHHSPYYGGGNHLTGTAWQCDSEILDPLRFKDPTPLRDGEYGRITIGKHNSIFIGGVIHELGHALSLPHCRQRVDEAERGTALMGSGNRTYAQELRNEGRGTFLTQAHAMRLAAHPVFNKRVASTLYDQPQVDWTELNIRTASDGGIQVGGNVQSSIPIHGFIAYFDPEGGSDYDATTATAVPNANGALLFHSGALRPGRSAELRLVACHVNGSTTMERFSYTVDATGRADLSKIRTARELGQVLEALRQSDLDEAEKRLKRILQRDETLSETGAKLVDRFRSFASTAGLDPNNLPASVRELPLTRLTPSIEKVGWIRPTYDAVPEKQRLLSLDGDFFASGIYGHAPAQHEYPLQGQWKRLRGRCGLQTGHPGKVTFQIWGDGKQLWKSGPVSPGPGAAYDLDVTAVENLSLRVGDAGNGTAADWGIWVTPTLSR